MKEQEHVIWFMHEAQKLWEHGYDFLEIVLVLSFISLFEQCAQQIKNVHQDGWVYYTQNFLVTLRWPQLFIRRVMAAQRLGDWAELEDWIFIVFVWRRIIVALDDFHDEWDESIDENVPAIIVVAPLLE